MRRSTDAILTTHVGALPGTSRGLGRTPARTCRACGRKSRTSSASSARRASTSSTKASSPRAATGSRSSTTDSAVSRPRETGALGIAPEAERGLEGIRRVLRRCHGRRHALRTDARGAQPGAHCRIRLHGRHHVYRTGSAAARNRIAARGAGRHRSRAMRSSPPPRPPASRPGGVNEHYRSTEEFVFALAEALRVEYEMIAKAGFVLQVDDAWLAALWDRIGIQMGLEAYKKFCMVRVDALNHALRNIPPEQVRYHLCWGSWHGPHAYDIPLAGHCGRDARRQCADLSVRSRQRAARARIPRLGAGAPARRQDPRAGRREPRHRADRASGPGLRAHPAVREARRAGERHCLHGLRARAAMPSADRVGEAERAHAKARDARHAAWGSAPAIAAEVTWGGPCILRPPSECDRSSSPCCVRPAVSPTACRPGRRRPSAVRRAFSCRGPRTPA